MAKKPYLLWNRNQLFTHLKAQANYYGIMDDHMFVLLKDAVYDERWEPSKDFNGCNIVQDDLHPFLPCFIHDWRWVTNQNAQEADYEFYYYLILCRVPDLRARFYYFAVRLGWFFYYRYAKRNG